MHENSVSVNENISGFTESILMPVDDQGDAAGEDVPAFADIVVGVMGTQEVVKYSNPELLGLLFPMLYVLGVGFYSLNYAALGNPQPIQLAGVDGANDPAAGAAVRGEEEEEEEADNEGAGQSEFDSDASSESGSDSTGSRSEEDENEGPAVGRRRYSRFTVKAYAKFRLLGPDRRFACSIKFIFMLFDWAQNFAI
ncbi:hypothetical protein BG000_000270 [Podila horticola]|nr:hypothetical protein BG000_000270 [Podila horticola]